MFIFHENYYSVANLLKKLAAQIVFSKQEASNNGKDEQMFGYIKYLRKIHKKDNEL